MFICSFREIWCFYSSNSLKFVGLYFVLLKNCYIRTNKLCWYFVSVFRILGVFHHFMLSNWYFWMCAFEYSLSLKWNVHQTITSSAITSHQPQFHRRQQIKIIGPQHRLMSILQSFRSIAYSVSINICMTMR